MSTVILGVDAATDVALAFYDIERDTSSIATFHMKTEGTIVEKLLQCRQHLPAEIKEYQPVFAMVEGPLQFVPMVMAEKRTKRRGWGKGDLFKGEGEGVAPQKVPMVNVMSVQQIAQLAGGLTMMLMGMNIEVEQVQPKTWQQIIPPMYRQSPDKKKNAATFCNALRITTAMNEHARDAAIIAYFAAGRYQELRATRKATAA